MEKRESIKLMLTTRIDLNQQMKEKFLDANFYFGIKNGNIIINSKQNMNTSTTNNKLKQDSLEIIDQLIENRFKTMHENMLKRVEKFEQV